MARLKEELFKFGKAELSACAATVADFTVSFLLAKVCGLWYGYATFVGALTGGLLNCTVNYRWVFHAQGQKKKGIALRYCLVWGVSILLNTCGTWSLTELSGIDFILVKAIVAVAVAVVWNNQMQRFFVFHRHQDNP